MDKRLKNAAIQGDVAFLRQAIASQKPLEYFKLNYIPRWGAEEVGGNIFHLAALNGRVEFIREALELLPFSVVHDLLGQTNEQLDTPLDEDFLLKHNEIVPLIEDLYERNNSMDSQLKNAAIQGDVEFLKQAVASKKPPEYFKSRCVPCPTGEDENGGNIFHLAAYHGKVEFFKAAMQTLPLSQLDLDILLWQSRDYGDNYGTSVLDIAEDGDSGRLPDYGYIAKEGDSWCNIIELIEGFYTGRNTMDPQLKEAAIEGDVKFLREAVASHKPTEYFQSLYCVPDPDYSGQVGNIFHLAAQNKRGEFLREAMERLSQAGVDVHLLLCQQDHPKWKSNPLHVATREGSNRIVKVILDYYYEKSLSAPANSSPPPSSSTSSAQSTNAMDCRSVKPWLVKDESGFTPFHYVMKYYREECVLKLLSIDSSVFSHMDDCGEDEAHTSPFVVALRRGFSKVIFKFREWAPNWHTFDKRVLACALAFAPNRSEEIFKLVLEQNLQVIEDRDFYHIWSPLKNWAFIGKLYPFEYVLKEEVRATNLGGCIVERILEENALLDVAKSDCDEDRGVEIARILVDACEKEIEQPNGVKLEQPWFQRDRMDGETVLQKAIEKRREKVASHFLSLKDIEVLLGEGDQFLFLAIKYKCHDVAQKILDLVDQHGLKTLLTSNTGRTILHDVPKCEENFVKQVVKRYPELLEQTDDDGVTVLHSWMEMGELWPVQCILNKDEFSIDIRRDFVKLLNIQTDDEGKNPLHVAAESAAKGGTDRIVRFLSDVLRIWECYLAVEQRDRQGNTPVDIALSNRREELALCLLPWSTTEVYRNCLFKAIDKQCHSIVKFILDRIHQHPQTAQYFLHNEQQNVLHIASNDSVDIAKLILERWPQLINERDSEGKTPLERASENGANSLVELILQKDHSCILKTPLAWVEACERGHASTVRAFVEKCSYFMDLCRLHKDTPLHHLRGVDYKEYKALIDHEFMKELKNTQNSDGETPLHEAIKRKDKNFAEILLRMDDVDRTIKDNWGKTAMELLKPLYDKEVEWKQMCEIIGFDPDTYIQLKADLTHMRDIISLVATLLATITFTAGFTLPGGFDSDSGEAILAKKAAFLVFLIADGYAMCTSMLVLFGIIWSMVSKRRQSSLLIDRSLVLLKHSLCGTLIAFIAGVYVVIHRKSLWTAIVILVMCSLVVITSTRSILHEVFLGLVPASDKDYLQCLCRWQKRKQKAPPPDNQSEVQEREPLNNQREQELDSMV